MNNLEKGTALHKDLIMKINSLIEENGVSPTVREILEKTTYKSTSTVKRYLDELENLGWISRMANKPRTIKVLIKL